MSVRDKTIHNGSGGSFATMFFSQIPDGPEKHGEKNASPAPYTLANTLAQEETQWTRNDSGAPF